MYTPIQSFRNVGKKGKFYHLLMLLLFFFAVNLFLLGENFYRYEFGNTFDLYFAIFTGISIPAVLFFVFELICRMLNVAFVLARNLLVMAKKLIVPVAKDAVQSAKSRKNNFDKTLAAEKVNAKDDPFDGRLDRGPFCLKVFAGFGLLSFIAVLIGDVLTKYPFGGGDYLRLALLAIVGSVAARYLLLIPITKRTRATGLNPWISLVLLIPPLNIPFLVFLLAAPNGAASSFRVEE